MIQCLVKKTVQNVSIMNKGLRNHVIVGIVASQTRELLVVMV